MRYLNQKTSQLSEYIPPVREGRRRKHTANPNVGSKQLQSSKIIRNPTENIPQSDIYYIR